MIADPALPPAPKTSIFLGTGGAAILMQPAAQLLQRRSRFPVFIDMPAELVLTGSANLTDKSIVVMPSLSGHDEGKRGAARQGEGNRRDGDHAGRP